jgi:hypothetical protein
MMRRQGVRDYLFHVVFFPLPITAATLWTPTALLPAAFSLLYLHYFLVA